MQARGIVQNHYAGGQEPEDAHQIMDRKRVLVIDDDPTVLRSVDRILNDAGYTVDLFENPDQALVWAVAKDYDVVLTDLRMPDIDGIDLLRNVRLKKPRLPVVVLTGYGTIDSAVEAMRLGASNYLEKPFTPDELMTAVDSAVRESSGKHSRTIEPPGQQTVRPFMERMRTRARIIQGRLVFPEGVEPRIIASARLLLDTGLASSVVLLGVPEEIRSAAAKGRHSLAGISTEAVGHTGLLERYAEEYFHLREHKGISRAEAKMAMRDPLNWGAMMLRTGAFDAMVVGAVTPTSSVLRAVLSVIGLKPGISLASSCFVMRLPLPTWGAGGHLVLADCAVNPDPSAEELAGIAVSASSFCRDNLEAEPRVAFLSFSTNGSADHPLVNKVRKACQIVRDMSPHLLVDGELQVDAALIPRVARQKSPESPIAGKANVLIFPDLNSGNIGYKLVQRLAGAQAYGPFLMGLAKPVSDLSRGCSVEDVVSTAVVTLAQAWEPVISGAGRGQPVVPALPLLPSLED